MLTHLFKRQYFVFSFFALILFVSFPAVSESQTSETQPKLLNEKVKEDLKKPVVMEDLAYGNILFEYYRGNPIKALNAILIAQEKNLLPNHAQSAKLLSGVIYLDLRMVSHAKAIFDELLSEEDLKTELLSKIEFYLGKLHYRQGDYKQAAFRLERIVNSLDSEVKDECLIMLSNIALAKKQLAVARNWLMQVSDKSKLAVFTRYNLGVVFLQENNLIEAEKLLIDLFPSNNKSKKKKPLSKVTKSLQDKAKVALGYYYLANKSYIKAREIFSDVRLDSLQSNKALLGMGWSYLESGEYKKALSHWIELQQRDVRDIAVQEALLAIPYAYHKLSSMQESLELYVFASDKFQEQINLIDELTLEIDKGQLVEKFISKIISKELIIDDSGVEDSRLFGDRFDYYLFELISQHDFNEKFRNYQKLGQLSNILDHWDEQLPLFSYILKTNEERFEERLPQVNQYLQKGSFDAYKKLLNKIQSDIAEVKNNNKLSTLADEEQLKIILRINRVIKKLQAIPKEMVNDEHRLKVARAQGIMKWQLEYGKADKIWELEKSAIKVAEILDEIDLRKAKLFNARNYAKTRFSGFEEKVRQGTDKLYNLKDKIKDQVGFQAGELKFLIKNVLYKRKTTLENFLLQADLSIARLHEQSIAIPESK